MESVFKKATTAVKTNVQISIKNEMNFCVSTPDLTCRIEDKFEIPQSDQITKWLDNLCQKTLTYKPLPQKALDNMKAKGISPKKQAGEVLNVVICSGKDSIVLCVKCPNNMKDEFQFDNFKKFLSDKEYNIEDVNVDDTVTYNLYNIKCDFPLKYRDNLNNDIVKYLEERKIYVPPDDDDDDFVNYLDELA